MLGCHSPPEAISVTNETNERVFVEIDGQRVPPNINPRETMLLEREVYVGGAIGCSIISLSTGKQLGRIELRGKEIGEHREGGVISFKFKSSTGKEKGAKK